MNKFEKLLCGFVKIDDRLDYKTYQAIKNEFGRKKAEQIVNHVVLQLDEVLLIKAFILG
jgi:hypothetical protein